MKKVILSIASMLFVGVMAVNAQVSQDTTSTSPSTEQSGMGTSGDQSNYTRDMEVIQSTDVPASLRSTLQGSEYSGWEEGKIYRNSSTNEYLIVVGDEDAKVYRFDANGSRIESTGAESGNSGSLNNGSGSSDMGTGTSGSDAGSTSGSSTGTDAGSTSGSSTSGSTGSGSTGSGSTSGTTESGTTTK